MKNKLGIVAVCTMGLLLSNPCYSSDMRDDGGPSWFKKVFVLGLLASSGFATPQDFPTLNPYKELNMSAYLRTNYDSDMPPGLRATPKYSYATYSSTTASPNPVFGDTYCLMQQAKVERSFEIRRTANAMFLAAQRPDIPDPEKYAMLASAIKIELASHMLEMEAAKFAASNGFYLSTGCAIPTPMEGKEGAL